MKLKERLLAVNTQSMLDNQCQSDDHPHVELTESLRWACVNCRETVDTAGYAVIQTLVGV